MSTTAKISREVYWKNTMNGPAVWLFFTHHRELLDLMAKKITDLGYGTNVRCQITESHISREMPNHGTGHLTDDRQIAGLGVSRGMLGSSLIVKRFTGSRQITRSRISQEMPNCRVVHFTGDGQITGPRISREMPNRRSEHFTSCQSLHIFLHCFIFLVLGLKI